MVILIPASAVVMGVVMITLAIVSNDGLVADDYYQRGLEINRSLVRDQRATRLSLRATLSWGPDAGTATITLSGGPQFVAPETLTLRLVNATRAAADRRILMHRAGANRYLGQVRRLPEGRWYAQIEGPDWRLIKELDGRSNALVRFRYQEEP